MILYIIYIYGFAIPKSVEAAKQRDAVFERYNAASDDLRSRAVTNFGSGHIIISRRRRLI